MKLLGSLKVGIFFLTAAITVMSLFMAGTVLSKDEVKLTPEFLASGKWVIFGFTSDGEACNAKVEFTEKGRFTIYKDCSHQAENFDVRGTYKIKGDKLVYVIEKSAANTAVEQGVKGEAALTDKDSLEYRWYLDFGNGPIGQVYNLNTLIKEGEAVSVKGTDSVSTGVKKGVVATKLKVMDAPGTSGKEVQFETCPDENPVMVTSIGKGRELTVYARTNDKVKTGKWNNYWYYVSFKTNTCDGAYTVKGWVFGEFVKIK